MCVWGRITARNVNPSGLCIKVHGRLRRRTTARKLILVDCVARYVYAWGRTTERNINPGGLCSRERLSVVVTRNVCLTGLPSKGVRLGQKSRLIWQYSCHRAAVLCADVCTCRGLFLQYVNVRFTLPKDICDPGCLEIWHFCHRNYKLHSYCRRICIRVPSTRKLVEEGCLH